MSSPRVPEIRVRVCIVPSCRPEPDGQNLIRAACPDDAPSRAVALCPRSQRACHQSYRAHANLAYSAVMDGVMAPQPSSRDIQPIVEVLAETALFRMLGDKS